MSIAHKHPPILEKRKVLMIFIKNTIKGRVKTRLAKTIGEEKALEVYKVLLEHTQQITQTLVATKQVYYSWHIQSDDIWAETDYEKQLQISGDLGQKMSHGFEQAFNQGKQKVVIIGSDCADLTTHIITTAFDQLSQHDFVVGPAQDGGYYLLGMNAYYPSVFENREWSTATVLSETLSEVKKLGKTYYLLPTLSDIDHYEDLPQHLKIKVGVV